MNAKLLKSKMVLYGDTQAELADALGLSQTRLSSKINEYQGAQFTQAEIKSIKERYALTDSEVTSIFFS